MANLLNSQRRSTGTLDVVSRIAGDALTSGGRRSLTDDVAPIVTVISPAAGTTLSSSTTAISVRVKDWGPGSASAGLLKRAIIYATFSDGTADEMVFNGTSFSSKYSAGSTATVISGGYDFSLVRAMGWRSNPTLKCYGVDAFANESTGPFTSFSWVYAADTTGPAPVIVSPAAHSTLTAGTDTITIDIADPSGLGDFLVWATFGDSGAEEVVFYGAFRGPYATGFSSLNTISNGYRLAIKRAGGWRKDPTLEVLAYDAFNNGAETTVGGWVYTPPTDTTAPTLAASGSPAAGSTLTLNQFVGLDVTDAGGLARTILMVSFADGTTETVYKSSGFTSKYSGSSTSVITNGTRYLVGRTGGWKQDPTFSVYARDTSGNEELTSATVTFVYTPDTTGPALAANTPSVGSTLATSTTPISVDVTDTAGVARTIVIAKFSTTEQEVAYDGAAWSSRYSFSSTTSITNGTRYSVIRTGGWLTNPTIEVESIDALGNRTDLATKSYVFTPTPPDTTPPAVTGLTPTGGTTLAASQTPVAFTVTEASGHLAFIFVTFGGITELAYDSNNGVGSAYGANSTATPSGADLAFSFRRDVGWFSNPTFRVVAFDAAGNQLDTSFSYVFSPPPMPTGGTPPYVNYSADQLTVTQLDFGSDVLVFPDLDETLTLVHDKRVLVEALARRFVTERGQLPFHENYGFDLRRLLNAPIRTSELAAIKTGVEDQCEDDERVLAAECAPEFNAATKTLRIPVEVETADGPFAFVLSVSSKNLTVAVENEGA
jgi:hypothetical protein